MTEKEWLTSSDPTLMLVSLLGKTSDRKMRLFACVCVRRDLFTPDEYGCETAVKVAERMSDELTTSEEVLDAVSTVEQYTAVAPDAWANLVAAAATTLRPVGMEAASLALENLSDFNWELFSTFDEAGCAAILRDIFGNPFRPTTPDPSLLTSTVVALATAIYNERAFDRLPILADALADAGADNDSELLRHLRGPGPHARGCWGVDLVLGKT